MYRRWDELHTAAYTTEPDVLVVMPRETLGRPGEASGAVGCIEIGIPTAGVVDADVVRGMRAEIGETLLVEGHAVSLPARAFGVLREAALDAWDTALRPLNGIGGALPNALDRRLPRLWVSNTVFPVLRPTRGL